jgi:hypothetical protein
LLAQFFKVYRFILISTGEKPTEFDAVNKEWEHALLQDTMDKTLNELNKRLVQKEVRLFAFLYAFICIDYRIDREYLTT